MNIPPIERRQLLQLLQLAAAAVGTLWLPRSAWSQPRLHSDPFGMGVASGSPAADSVVLWARLQLPRGQTQPVTVRWEHGYYSTYCHMRADNPDLVVFFERLHLRVPQRQPSRARATRGWGTSLDDYRRHYATVSTLARFVVPAGRAVIERA